MYRQFGEAGPAAGIGIVGLGRGEFARPGSAGLRALWPSAAMPVLVWQPAPSCIVLSSRGDLGCRHGQCREATRRSRNAAMKCGLIVSAGRRPCGRLQLLERVRLQSNILDGAIHR